MRRERRNRVLRFIGAAFGAALMVVASSSCERIYDDLPPCPHGVSLRFVYDYNMEYANSFPRKVDCLTLLVYDERGRHVDTKVVTGPELRDENYRMRLDLEEGSYRFVAYGGLACGERSFILTGVSSWADLRVRLDAGCLAEDGRKRLHDLYWGDLVLATGDLYREGTIEMMKNTNNIRIVLQQEDGGALSPDDFWFEITDDNTLFGPDNDLIAAGEVTYTPWKTGQAQTGVSIVGNDRVEPVPVEVAYAELSTSRLMLKNEPKLLVRRRSDGGTVVELPLKRYLLMLCSDRYDMGDQEFLDRESDFALFFFLRPDGAWIDTKIVVNDWVVRINDTEL